MHEPCPGCAVASSRTWRRRPAAALASLEDLRNADFLAHRPRYRDVLRELEEDGGAHAVARTSVDLQHRRAHRRHATSARTQGARRSWAGPSGTAEEVGGHADRLDLPHQRAPLDGGQPEPSRGSRRERRTGWYSSDVASPSLPRAAPCRPSASFTPLGAPWPRACADGLLPLYLANPDLIRPQVSACTAVTCEPQSMLSSASLMTTSLSARQHPPDQVDQ